MEKQETKTKGSDNLHRCWTRRGGGQGGSKGVGGGGAIFGGVGTQTQ